MQHTCLFKPLVCTRVVITYRGFCNNKIAGNGENILFKSILDTRRCVKDGAQQSFRFRACLNFENRWSSLNTQVQSNRTTRIRTVSVRPVGKLLSILNDCKQRRRLFQAESRRSSPVPSTRARRSAYRCWARPVFRSPFFPRFVQVTPDANSSSHKPPFTTGVTQARSNDPVYRVGIKICAI